MNKKLPLEDEIINLWKETESIKVSIISLTYNHEKFVKKAIESFLSQKTKFPFEIIIHDDASSDKTPNIIRKYQSLYPRIIRVIYQKENQYSKGVNLAELLFNMTKGEFIALCEGDDFWIDNQKLQIQVDAMLKHPQCGLSFHKAQKLNMKDGSINIIGEYENLDKLLNFETILTRSNGMIPTGSMMFRRKRINRIIEFINNNPYLNVGDIYIQFISAFNEGAMYINREMSVYRFQSNGSWSNTLNVNYQFQVDFFYSRLKSYIALFKEFKNSYEHIFITMCIGVTIQLIDSLSNINIEKAQKIQLILVTLLKKNLKKYDLEKGIVLYGASSLTHWFIQTFKDIKIKYILDENEAKDNTIFCDYNVYNPSNCKVSKNDIFLITLWGREYGILNTLKSKYDYNTELHISISLNSMSIFQEILEIIEE